MQTTYRWLRARSNTIATAYRARFWFQESRSRKGFQAMHPLTESRPSEVQTIYRLSLLLSTFRSGFECFSFVSFSCHVALDHLCSYDIVVKECRWKSRRMQRDQKLKAIRALIWSGFGYVSIIHTNQTRLPPHACKVLLTLLIIISLLI